MVTRSKECTRRALVCLLNLAITLESLIAVLVFDHSSHNSSKQDSDDKQYNSLMTLWILMQYASFGASIVFAVAVWIARNARALVLLSNALFFALYGLQWLVLAICAFAEGYSTTGTVSAALTLHPLLGFTLSRSLGREAREEADRQEALEITLEHEVSMYHSAEV